MQIGQLLEECREQGWTVHQLHPKTRAPIGFDAPNMHVRMSAIAKYEGQGFPAGWFLVEAKAISDSLMQSCIAHKIEKAYPNLYGHCVIGMGLSKIDSCVAFLSSDDGEVYIEVIASNPALFKRLMALVALIGGNEPPPRLPVDECGNCPLVPVCHEEAVLKVSCYSCHACLLADGGVHCAKYGRKIDGDDAKFGCTEHLYNPHLVSFGQYLGATTLENGENAHIYEVDGKKIMNVGAKASKSGLMFSSREIEIGGSWAIADPTVQAFKEQFAGSKIISSTNQDS